TVHAIALSDDDTLQALVFESGFVQFLQLGANDTWGPTDSFNGAPDFPPLIRMDAHEGSVAAIAELGSTVLLRSADGTWSVEEAPGLPSGPAAHLAYGPDGTVHVAQGGGQLELPGYARRPAEGGWESVPLPDGMVDGFSTPVTVIDDLVHVCTAKYPDVLCTSSASSFTELTDVFAFEASSVDLAGSWMLLSSGTANPLTFTLTARRFDGRQWASISELTLDGALGPVAVHEDAAGDLHVAAMTIAEAGQTGWNLRYLKFGQDGAIEQSWVHCSVVSADVAGHGDGTPVVSFSTADEVVFLARPG
ncbi:MAG: hypothetical protein R6X02_20835, partial [Enhygromyxa sp.]